jgi:serine/threonine protein kinase
VNFYRIVNSNFSTERALFEGASTIESLEERALFLEQTCQGNPELRKRIEKLLFLQESAERFFETPRRDLQEQTEPSAERSSQKSLDQSLDQEMDTRVGRYRLLDRLGEGGCGIVYLAEQMEPVRRRVALKIIRLGMDTENVIARFEMERQALAMMDHPNIARVYDAGATSSGRPFFVMQWVEGEKITDFCDNKQLTIRQRVELFTRVCHAIQHAHQKGVIHRDIKPSNIIVMEIDGVAVPKVIDFGVAKATTGTPDESFTFTMAGQLIGTPAYMSPEQAGGNGMDVDTRCDIYALGTLLYELLTGRPPFDPKKLQNSDVTEIRRILREEDPRDPSAAVEALNPEKSREVAALRSCDPQKLPPLLRGDLDRIVMMAMEKDRQRRYGSADALAADLWRYLHDEPVMARPSSRLYRFRRLVRRNKVVFAAGSMVMATLIAGFGTSTWLFMREKQAREEQTRLRSEAEAARTEETKLRGQAEAREACAQAAVKLSYGQIEQADELLASIPSDMIPSSLEAADAYREVGEWHRKAGRIQQSAERFTALAASITAVDRSDIYQISIDLLPAAVATCKAGDWSRYEQVRQIALERYGDTQNPIVAEQIMKACMLRPADPAAMAKIAKLATFLENAIGIADSQVIQDTSKSWACLSLALWNHRRGNPEQVIRWGELTLQHDLVDQDRVACFRLLLAMARQQMGETEQARMLLEEAAKSIRAMMVSSSEKLDNDIIAWVGWNTAQILQEEAEAMIGR